MNDNSNSNVPSKRNSMHIRSSSEYNLRSIGNGGHSGNDGANSTNIASPHGQLSRSFVVNSPTHKRVTSIGSKTVSSPIGNPKRLSGELEKSKQPIKSFIADRVKFFSDKEAIQKEKQIMSPGTPPKGVVLNHISNSKSPSQLDLQQQEPSPSVNNSHPKTLISERIKSFSNLNLNDHFQNNINHHQQQPQQPQQPQSKPKAPVRINSMLNISQIKNNHQYQPPAPIRQPTKNVTPRELPLPPTPENKTPRENKTTPKENKTTPREIKTTPRESIPIISLPPPPTIIEPTLPPEPLQQPKINNIIESSTSIYRSPPPPPKNYMDKINISKNDIQISLENPSPVLRGSSVLSQDQTLVDLNFDEASSIADTESVMVAIQNLSKYEQSSSSSPPSSSPSSSPNPNTMAKLEQQCKVLTELYSTEQDYLRDLDFIINEMIKTLSAKGFDKTIVMGVFSNIEIIRNLSKTIVDDLKSCKDGITLHNVVTVFKKMSAFFKMYSQYCTHHSKSMDMVVELSKNNEKFNNFKTEIMNLPESRGLKIQDYLIKPIQRICKYPLLFNELMKTTSNEDPDFKDLEAVHSKLVEVAAFVNEFHHITEGNERLLELQNIIEGAPFNIIESTRKILKEATVKMKEFEKDDYHTRFIFIFNDTIVFTKYSSFTKKYHFSFNLPYHSSRVTPSIKDRSFHLSGTNKEGVAINLELQCEDEQEKDTISNLLIDLMATGKKHFETMRVRGNNKLSPTCITKGTATLSVGGGRDALSRKSSIHDGLAGSSTLPISGSNSINKYSSSIADPLSPTYLFNKSSTLSTTSNEANQALFNLSKLMKDSGQDIKKKRETLNITKK
ncbi:hypothetical protein CYY_003200 [Polysphondylium violaceum]|uniref:DH domain-containing protein n=1 Tax=Polysphondylium violaceum TaxID=133409 RepID=A0A8J4V1I9_9MYCE|nr:hypothetical protein CYY_003200 [Polysphondylium violaceum]